MAQHEAAGRAARAPLQVATSDDDEALGWDSGAEYTPSGAAPASALRHRKRANLFGERVVRKRAAPPRAAPAPAPAALGAPLRRNLRTRKIAQLHPYTVEAMRYRRELYQNDWEDAVVPQREWQRREREWRAREPRGEPRESQGWLVSDAGSDADAEGAGSDSGSDSESDAPASQPSAPSPGEVLAERRAARARRSPGAPARRRSPSLTADPPAATGEERRSAERSAPAPASPTSSDSTDYERRFRTLKRMMPARMARKCIDDLRAMRHGREYHSDDAESPSTAHAPPVHIRVASRSPTSSPERELRPGEARRRIATSHADGGRVPLLSESETSESEPPSPARSPSPTPVNTDLRQWYQPRPRGESPIRERDPVDRMLTRTSGARSGFGQRVSQRGAPSRHAAAGSAGSGSFRGYMASFREPRLPSMTSIGDHAGPEIDTEADEPDDQHGRRSGPRRARDPMYVFEMDNDTRMALAERYTNVPRGHRRELEAKGYVPVPAPRVDLGSRHTLLGEGRRVSVRPRRVGRRAGAGAAGVPGAVPGGPAEAPPAGGPGREPGPRPAAPKPAPPAPAPAPAPPAASPLPAAFRRAAFPDAPDLQAQLAELCTWETFENVSLHFGVVPPPAGVRFAPHTALGRGRLHELLHPPAAPVVPDPAVHHVLGHSLSVWMGEEELDAVLPSVLDAAADAAAAPAEDGHPALGGFAALLHFFGVWLSWQVALARGDSAPPNGLPAASPPVRTATCDPQRACAMLLDAAQALLDRLHAAPGAAAHEAVLLLLWHRVELVWRIRRALPPDERSPREDLALLEHAQPLMLTLLASGMHHTAASLAHTRLEDVRAELWVALVHVLGALDADAFWDVLEAALDEWQAVRAPPHAVVWAECVWFVVLTLGALAHVGAAAGVAGSAPHLSAPWRTVQRALGAARLRFDERVERVAPRAAVRRRDAYVRVVLERCLLLASRWHFGYGGVDGVVARAFDLFDQHRLADLPSESDHDFAPFLRQFDMALVFDEQRAPPRTAFQLYLQLLGRAGAALQAAAPSADAGARQLARFFSRVTPVRVMPFTREHAPTSAERAMLFNHYSAVMLFLYFVPGAAVQRLRQIKSFLPFGAADRVSQVTCVRAVVYAGALFRHHALDVAPVVAWLAEVMRALEREYAELCASVPLGEHAAARHARRVHALAQRETVRMVVVLVRSVQHMVAHPRMDGGRTHGVFPPVGLLHEAWTQALLASPLGAEGPVMDEVLRCVLSFLAERRQAVGGPAPPAAPAASPPHSPSSASDAELDALCADASLAALLGEDAAPAAPDPAVRAADEQLAEHLHTHVSPALFQRLTDWAHAPPETVARDGRALPERALETEQMVRRAEEAERLALLVDAWAACAQVLVQRALRDWRGYMTLGNESWKRLSDPRLKRDVALRFVVHMLEADRGAFAQLAPDVLAVWLQSLAAPRGTLQAQLTAQLALADPHSALLAGVQELVEPQECLATWRLPVVQRVLHNMAALGDARGVAIPSVSALLSAIRVYAGEVRGNGLAGDGLAGADASELDPAAYLAFCSAALAAVRAMGPLLLRAVGTELHTTEAIVERATGAVGSPAAPAPARQDTPTRQDPSGAPAT